MPGENNRTDNGIMDSIAALRSVLMLDTPTRNLLGNGRITRKQQPEEQSQRKLCFSPASTQATTPGSKNTLASEQNRKFTNEITARSVGLPPLGGKPSSPHFLKTPSASELLQSPEVQSAKKILQKKVEILEATQAELEDRLQGEIDQRTTLRTTYEKLLELQTKQSSQLQQIALSRDALLDESFAVKKTLDTERIKHARALALLKTNANTFVESRFSKERESLKSELETLRKKMQRKDARYADSESLVKSLTKEVERLNDDLNKLRQSHESAKQVTTSNHAKAIGALHSKIEQTETEWLKQVNKERKNAEENYQKLQKVRQTLKKMQDDRSIERENMESERFKLRDSLHEAMKETKEQKHKVQSVNNNVHLLNRLLNEERLAATESEHKLKRLTEELETTKSRLDSCKNLKSEKEVLEQRLRKAEEKLSTLSNDSNGQPPIPEESQEEEKILLNLRLEEVEADRMKCQKDLQQTRMELDSLKQNLDEAERIELRNEELETRLQSMSDKMKTVDNLRERLKAYESDTMNKDQSLSNTSEQIQDLQQELKETNKNLDNALEKLGISAASNLNRMVEVATHRDKVRDLEDDLEELEDKLNGDSEESDGWDKKRENEVEDVSRKRTKLTEEVEMCNVDDDDDEIVL